MFRDNIDYEKFQICNSDAVTDPMHWNDEPFEEIVAREQILGDEIKKLGKGENFTTDVLAKIFKALDCDFADIMEITIVVTKRVVSFKSFTY